MCLASLEEVNGSGSNMPEKHTRCRRFGSAVCNTRSPVPLDCLIQHSGSTHEVGGEAELQPVCAGVEVEEEEAQCRPQLLRLVFPRDL